MGRILIDTRDIRGAARDLRGGVGAISEARASVNSVFRGSWLGPNGGGFQSRWDQELAVISQVGNEVERIAGDLDGYASRVDSEQRLGSLIRGVAGWTLRTGKSLLSRVARFFQAGWDAFMAFLTRIANLIREAIAFLKKIGIKFVKVLVSKVSGLKWVVGALVGFAALLFSAVTSENFPGYPLRTLRDGYFALWAIIWPAKVISGPSQERMTLSPIADAANCIKSLKVGEFEIRDDGNGNIIVLLRGLEIGSKKANSAAETGSEKGGFGPYSAQVEAAIRAFKRDHYPNADISVSFVGHSQGGIAARNIVGDSKFWGNGITIGTVVTIESPVDGIDIPSGAPSVYQFNNTNSKVSKMDFGWKPLVAKLFTGSPGDTKNEHVVNVATGGGHAVDQFNKGDFENPQDKEHWANANKEIAANFSGKACTAYRYQRP